ncbi:aldehyde dehydrogenase family protein [Micromonospora sp. NBC_01813]|uniref:aldehyde dehydrogenase family protein n=1 Tax=Micromonospora sp. NBC_01813 TaxID=2975988 RepID=UPI002DD84247|nr:aldehyde dehydrogenase family protein [Micromonospora sp. NBC_01813]WSA10041.1 aldehyde dehydrogenase family protein [Micromonospora sp. NBC_01813]
MNRGYRSVDPSNGELIADTPASPPKDVTRALETAAATQQRWRTEPPTVRADRLRALSAALGDARDELAQLLVREIGKPVGQAQAEVDKCRALCDGYADQAEALLAPRRPLTGDLPARIRLRPTGVILGVMPWNFPYWQALRFAVPNLLLGNTCLIKPAPNAALATLALTAVADRAGLPPGALTALLVQESGVADVIAHPAVTGVSVTGSVAAGSAIAAMAGAAVKKVVLELGGSDPFIVLADADVPAAAAAAARSRLGNAGQSCVAAKRFLVERPVAEEFVTALTEQFAAQRVGHPADPDTTVGPLARADLRDRLHEQVRASVEAGAKIILGGAPAPGVGYYYPPTVLTDVPVTAPVWRDETFGPVAPVMVADTPQDLLRLADNDEFGLGASVWTASAAQADRFADALAVGMVFVNELVQSDWRLPFGGVRRSGIGRELASEGISEFANIQAHWYGRMRGNQAN